MQEIKSCTKEDICYPKRLRDDPFAPDTLYYIGDIGVCNSSTIAVIGKRETDSRHSQIASRIGALLAKKGYTVLNGLAIGIDRFALEGSISVGGKTIAVMPGGLDQVYPKSNKDLAEQIVNAGGCLISEYPPGTRPQKYTFVKRDRIQALLANKVFIVDAEKSGGTMHTADFATKVVKPLGCFIEKNGASPAGNQYLVDSHRATAVHDTADMLSFLELPDYEQVSLDYIQ